MVVSSFVEQQSQAEGASALRESRAAIGVVASSVPEHTNAHKACSLSLGACRVLVVALAPVDEDTDPHEARSLRVPSLASVVVIAAQVDGQADGRGERARGSCVVRPLVSATGVDHQERVLLVHVGAVAADDDGTKAALEV